MVENLPANTRSPFWTGKSSSASSPTIRIDKPGLHTSEDARWDYRIIITYPNYEASRHEGEVQHQLFPDTAALNRDEDRRWELTVNHWDLPIHQIDPHAAQD